MNLTVRRRWGLMAVVALVALLVAGGYLWRWAATQSEAALLVGIALGLVAVVFGIASGDARTPLLVGDNTGLRVRLGRDWTGIPWGQVQRVEVAERGRLRDGHVAVMTTSAAASLEAAPWRSRLAATINRMVYDAPFVVPYGPTTAVSVVDVEATLTRLADGRAPVVRVDVEAPEPQPTVELTGEVEAAESQPDRDGAGPDDVRVGDDARADELAVPEAGARDRGEPEPAPVAPEPPFAVPLGSRPGRRAEVTVPYAEPATLGMLALSEPSGDPAHREIPESELLLGHDAASRDDRTKSSSTRGHGNVALIIDATTDMSRRAMSRVRRPASGTMVDKPTGTVALAPEPADDVGVVVVQEEPAVTPLLIGAELARARHQLGLTIDDLADRTRIRPSVIEALEVDDVAPCGGDFYARGHLRMLARVLGIDADKLLETYDAHFATNPVSPRQVFEVELASGTTGMVRGTRGGSRWGGLIAAVLVLMMAWGVAQYFLDDTGAPDTTRDTTVPLNPAGLGSPGVGNPPVEPETTAEPATTWVRVTAVGGVSRVFVKDASGEVVFRGVLTDGERHRVSGESPLMVRAGDGGIVRLGSESGGLGLMGAPGEQSRERVKAPTERGGNAGNGGSGGNAGDN